MGLFQREGYFVSLLSLISEILAKENANVVKLEHNQFKAINRIHNVLLEVTVETNGHEHIEKIINSFERDKYSIKIMY